MLLRKLIASTLALVMLTVVFVFVPHDTGAYDGPDDGYGYHWVDSKGGSPSVAFNWIEISYTGTDVGFYQASSVYAGPFSIGFDFEFYGTTYSEFYVTANGLIEFGYGSASTDNYDIPSYDGPGNMIAPFWGSYYVDYDPYNSGAVHYETYGTSPNQQLIVQWSDVSYLGSYDLMTFQVRLNETGEIWFNYLEMNGEDGSSETVGIEAPSEEIGCKYSYNEPAIEDNLAIMFTEEPVSIGPDQTAFGDFGSTAEFNLVVRNNQDITDSFDIENVTDLGWTVITLEYPDVPLVDSNLNGIPDTGDLAPDEELVLVLTVAVPMSPAAQNETVVVTATSFADPSVSDTATLVAQCQQVTFAPPHSDYGYDADLDTDYDSLVIAVSLQAFSGGDVGIDAWLYDGLDEQVSYVYLTQAVPAGPAEVYVEFPGEDVFRSLYDGSFRVGMWLSDRNDVWIEFETHYTSSYNHDEFDPPPAMLMPPYEEYLPDEDDDSLYDSLTINVTVDIFDAGEHTLQSLLWVGGTLLTLDVTDTYSAGSHLIPLEFSAWEIRASGEDGPYYLELDLEDEFGATLDYDDMLTAAYLHTDFEGAPAYFEPPHSDEGVDTDDDSYYNYLLITINIACSDTGYYDLVVEVEDNYWQEFALIEETLYLEEWTTTPYEITLSAYDIRMNGVSGVFRLTMSIYDTDTTFEYDTSTYTTSYYYTSYFEPLGAYFVSYMHTDEAIDEDSDTYYERILVTLYVNASMTGLYDLEVTIYDPWNYECEVVEFQLSLFENELRSVEVEISASLIQNRGLNGYWDLYLVLSDSFNPGYWYDSEYYTTSLYYSYEFEQALLALDPPHSDYALDLNGNSLYDLLVIEVNIELYVAGTYTVIAELNTPWGTPISEASVTESMAGSYHQSEFEFEGWPIARDYISGSFRVDITVETLDSMVIDTDTYWTSYYYYWDFETVPGEFGYPHEDFGVDTDNDSLFEYLVVAVAVEVYDAGYFVVRGTLYDDYLYVVDIVENVTYLNAGSRVVELWYSGWVITVSSADPYYVSLDLEDIAGIEMDQESYFINGIYYREDFDAAIPTIEAGWAYDSPVIDGMISPDEWFGAETLDLAAADVMNDIEATVHIFNDGTNLFIGIDATGDLTESSLDAAGVSFDTDNDNSTTDWHDDQFVLGTTPDGSITYHTIYSPATSTWALDCSPFDTMLPDHEGLEGESGFGVSPASNEDHRMYEFSIPLALLGALPGDVLGFGVFSELAPGVADGDAEAYSSWPAYFESPPPMHMYGDLILSEERPLTTVELDGTEGENGWFVSDVVVTMSASGGVGGIDGTYYRLDSGAWQEYDTPFTISSDGSHSLEYYSSDSSEVDEFVHAVGVLIDTEEPETDVELLALIGENGWAKDEVVLAFSPFDETSGIVETSYRLDGGNWTVLSSSSIGISEDGEHTIEYYSVDAAGHEESTNTMEFKIDSAPPSTTYALDGSKVTLTAADNTSGVNRTYYRIDGGTWQVYNGQFEVKGEGDHSVQFYSVDYAGNNETIRTVSVEGATSFLSSAGLLIAMLVILLLAVVAALIILGMRRKGRGPNMAMQDMVPGEAQIEGGPGPGQPDEPGPQPPGGDTGPEPPP